jgi:hypothetical protein
MTGFNNLGQGLAAVKSVSLSPTLAADQSQVSQALIFIDCGGLLL